MVMPKGKIRLSRNAARPRDGQITGLQIANRPVDAVFQASLSAMADLDDVVRRSLRRLPWHGLNMRFVVHEGNSGENGISRHRILPVCVVNAHGSTTVACRQATRPPAGIRSAQSVRHMRFYSPPRGSRRAEPYLRQRHFTTETIARTQAALPSTISISDS